MKKRGLGTGCPGAAFGVGGAGPAPSAWTAEAVTVETAAGGCGASCGGGGARLIPPLLVAEPMLSLASSGAPSLPASPGLLSAAVGVVLRPVAMSSVRRRRVRRRFVFADDARALAEDACMLWR